jgi:hypothetical protein
MGKSCGIDDDKANPLVPGMLYPVNQRSLVVALETSYRGTRRFTLR